ncbi:hypothetical protein BTI99_04450 [Lactobacillus delbrueckii subsp. bulgaricus]|nr:hypothetical protein [Lactobacillus delbrueckii subsp. bulgaricus]MBT9039367.1 hypothetical protein [Lactobacillus delbrueckii subsp. bulgaricus]
MNSNFSMYMITHKDVDFVPNGRIPLFVGNGENKHNWLRDNLGDNIASKNPNYCELTALYYLWKNDKTDDYLSIEHYRRFFKEPYRPTVISKDKILTYLQKYDIVTTQYYNFGETINEYYSHHHIEDDMVKVEKVIEKKYPEYIPALNTVLTNNFSAACNMIATSKEKFDEYCKWLFDILFSVESEIDIINRDDYQKRVFGFLSERLQNVWIIQNELTIKALPLYMKQESKVRTLIDNTKLELHNDKATPKEWF